MRSFSRIADEPCIKDSLTSAMHVYEDAEVDLAETYRKLFNASAFTEECKVSADNILDTSLDFVELIDTKKYPLLNRSLLHVPNYLWLWLRGERTLIRKYNINVRKHDQLTRIIIKAFPGDDIDSLNSRVFLLSRKTLLNEFNHFEQDLNLFQPALDITDTVLIKREIRYLVFLV